MKRSLERKKEPRPKEIDDFLKAYNQDPYTALGLHPRPRPFQEIEPLYYTLTRGKKDKKHECSTAAFKILSNETLKEYLDHNLPRILQELNPQKAPKFNLNLTKVDPTKYYEMYHNKTPYEALEIQPSAFKDLTNNAVVELVKTKYLLTKQTIDNQKMLDDARTILERPNLRHILDKWIHDNLKPDTDKNHSL